MTFFPPGRGRELLETEDFLRIKALPRRTEFDSEKWTRELTEVLRAPGGTQTLRSIQAQSLYEIGTEGGLFAPIRVGGGKTLVSLLAPFVSGATRPVLLLPAALKDKTEHNRRTLAKHWRVARDLRLISYEELGRVSKAEALQFYRPDLIIADEVHRLKNRKAACTKRVERWMREHPETRFIGMSGTAMKGSIKEFAHILAWALKERAPIPLHSGELDELADALDEGVNFVRCKPGPWIALARPEDVDPENDTRTARLAFQRRLVETPGVVASAGDQVACSLYIDALEFTPGRVTDENFELLRTKWQTPDGWAFSTAVDAWRYARQLALGFHYVWDPRPPENWLLARREWSAFVRETLSHSRSLDSELQVAQACARGALPDVEYRAWLAVKDTFRINPKDVWHDTTALDTCAKWMKDAPGIVWVEHTFFGDELAARTGASFFRQGTKNKAGMGLQTLSDLILDGREKPRSIVASIDACGTGLDLQPWSRNLYTSCPTSATKWEQSLGRTHRDGQEADQVTAEVLFACVDHFFAWDAAVRKARMAEETLGQPQKILFADVTMPTEFDLVGRAGYRWTKQKVKTTDTED